MEAMIVFTAGASVYPLIETIWRGYSHWTMQLLGGICFLIIYYTEKKSRGTRLQRCIFETACITAAELLSGIVFNIILGMDVWDYSGVPFNFLGQICAEYTAFWFLLTAALTYVCAWMRKSLRQYS